MDINNLLLVLQEGKSVKYQSFSTTLKKFEINLKGGKFPVLPSMCMMTYHFMVGISLLISPQYLLHGEKFFLL